MTREIKGFTIDPGRFYSEDHFWVLPTGGAVARIGMDPLGVETMGDVVQIVLQEEGTELRQGIAFGSLEAAKFVGPMTMPVSGRIVATNASVVADPLLIHKDPLGDGWLLEVELTESSELDELMTGEAFVTWFEAKVDDYRVKGVLSE